MYRARFFESAERHLPIVLITTTLFKEKIAPIFKNIKSTYGDEIFDQVKSTTAVRYLMKNDAMVTDWKNETEVRKWLNGFNAVPQIDALNDKYYPIFTSMSRIIKSPELAKTVFNKISFIVIPDNATQPSTIEDNFHYIKLVPNPHIKGQQIDEFVRCIENIATKTANRLKNPQPNNTTQIEVKPEPVMSQDDLDIGADHTSGLDLDDEPRSEVSDQSDILPVEIHTEAVIEPEPKPQRTLKVKTSPTIQENKVDVRAVPVDIASIPPIPEHQNVEPAPAPSHHASSESICKWLDQCERSKSYEQKASINVTGLRVGDRSVFKVTLSKERGILRQLRDLELSDHKMHVFYNDILLTDRDTLISIKASEDDTFNIVTVKDESSEKPLVVTLKTDNVPFTHGVHPQHNITSELGDWAFTAMVDSLAYNHLRFFKTANLDDDKFLITIGSKYAIEDFASIEGLKTNHKRHKTSNLLLFQSTSLEGLLAAAGDDRLKRTYIFDTIEKSFTKYLEEDGSDYSMFQQRMSGVIGLMK
ncbi:putative structural protein P61 [Antheraea assamensis cypovirus 4]|uniref:Structural protein P61 n=1 Tax=Antheraea assamensis cypovirus 4 TaxID=180166 RepID=A0AAE9N5U1_9REOV|nr:putative structural protein P61 [Antheraea assamensis cypovirus 4]